MDYYKDQSLQSSNTNKILRKTAYFLAICLCVGIIVSLLGYRAFFSAPKNFEAQNIKIDQGQSLVSISNELERRSIIRSASVFQTLVIFLGGERRLQPGEYQFENPSSVLVVATRFVARDFGILKRRVTFPEGITRNEMSVILSERITDFDSKKFLLLTEGKEGYLFPDTYYFFPGVTPEEVVETLEENFDRKIRSLESGIQQSGRSTEDIVIMASIIEKEAFGDNDRKVVSGILWERLRRGMLLQVDAPFLFLLGKASSELTLKDLAIDSPYNTYKYKGLPPTPIGNPGMESLRAAIDPEESEYLFYLHDENGTIHYARDFDGHKRNKSKYLR